MTEKWHVQLKGRSDYVLVDVDGVRRLVREGRFTPECHVFDAARRKWIRAAESPLALVFDELIADSRDQPCRSWEDALHAVSEERAVLERAVEEGHAAALGEREPLHRELESIKAKLIADPAQVSLALRACDVCDALETPEHAVTILRDVLAFSPGEPRLVSRLRAYLGTAIKKEPNVEKRVPYEKDLFRQVIAYPFREGGVAIFLFPVGVWMLSVAAWLASNVSFVIGLVAGTVIFALYAGYAVPLMISIVRTTVDGRDNPPFVDFMDWFEYMPELFAMTVGVLIYSLPVYAAVGLGYGHSTAVRWAGTYVPIVVSVVGPWLLVSLFVEQKTFVAYNPASFVRGVIAIGPRYWLAVVLVFVIGMPVVALGALAASADSELGFMLPAAQFYVWVMQARIAGLVYRERRHACRDLFE